MKPELDLKLVARNVWRDSMRDGLMELFTGMYLLLTGIVIQADMSYLFILLVVFLPGFIRKMKERYTHPRIGYVKLPDSEKSLVRKVLAMLVGGMLALALVIFLSSENEEVQALTRWVTLLPAVVLAAVLFTIGARTGFLRYHLMAAFSLLSGLAIPLLGLSDSRMDGMAIYFMIVGAVLLLWGGMVFINFLRAYPVRTEEAG